MFRQSLTPLRRRLRNSSLDRLRPAHLLGYFPSRLDNSLSYILVANTVDVIAGQIDVGGMVVTRIACMVVEEGGVAIQWFHKKRIFHLVLLIWVRMHLANGFTDKCS